MKIDLFKLNNYNYLDISGDAEIPKNFYGTMDIRDIKNVKNLR